VPTGIILIVDDSLEFCRILEERLSETVPGVNVLHAQSVSDAAAVLRASEINVVISDMVMGEKEAGFDLLVLSKRRNPCTQFLVLTEYPSIKNVERCMRAGCYAYVEKTDLEGSRFAEVVTEALALSRVSVDRDATLERLILADWNTLRSVKERLKKGAVLEDLCSSLFRTVDGWNRIDGRVNTRTEEIDLLILNESRDEFWKRFGSFILVECKNWVRKRKPGRKEFDSFYLKMQRRGQQDCRLGFFISLNGVATTFAIEQSRIAKESTRVVTLDGEEIWQLICAPDRSGLLKQLVAREAARR